MAGAKVKILWVLLVGGSDRLMESHSGETAWHTCVIAGEQ